MATATKPNTTAPAADAKLEALKKEGAQIAADKAAKAANRALRVPMQPNLKARIETEAKAKNVSPSIYIRDLLAEKFEIKIEATAKGGRKVYANKDERKAASKERRLTRAALVKNLLAKHEAEQAAAQNVAA